MQGERRKPADSRVFLPNFLRPFAIMNDPRPGVFYTSHQGCVMHKFNPRAYGPAVVGLLKDARVNELGPGEADGHVRGSLAALTAESVTAPHTIADQNEAIACLAGLWLRHDFLDESHRISQSVETPSGSYWHALVHRREPDFSNAKYWFRRVGEHPIFPQLHEAARHLAQQANVGQPAQFLMEQSAWDALRFVDLCEYALDDLPPIHTLCMNIQKCEWELLFDHCYRQAIDD